MKMLMEISLSVLLCFTVCFFSADVQANNSSASNTDTLSSTKAQTSPLTGFTTEFPSTTYNNGSHSTESAVTTGNVTPSGSTDHSTTGTTPTGTTSHNSTEVSTATPTRNVTEISTPHGHTGTSESSSPKPEPTTPSTPCEPRKGFDGLSFFGGIVLGLGMCAIICIGYKYYQSRQHKEAPYHQF